MQLTYQRPPELALLPVPASNPSLAARVVAVAVQPEQPAAFAVEPPPPDPDPEPEPEPDPEPSGAPRWTTSEW